MIIENLFKNAVNIRLVHVILMIFQLLLSCSWKQLFTACPSYTTDIKQKPFKHKPSCKTPTLA